MMRFKMYVLLFPFCEKFLSTHIIYKNLQRVYNIYDVAIYTLSYDNYYTKIHIEKETALICVSKINMKKN